MFKTSDGDFEVRFLGSSDSTVFSDSKNSTVSTVNLNFLAIVQLELLLFNWFHGPLVVTVLNIQLTLGADFLPDLSQSVTFGR